MGFDFKTSRRVNNFTALRTYEEVGKIMGLSRERVRQIERSAFRKIKKDPVVRKFAEDLLIIPRASQTEAAKEAEKVDVEATEKICMMLAERRETKNMEKAKQLIAENREAFDVGGFMAIFNVAGGEG